MGTASSVRSTPVTVSHIGGARLQRSIGSPISVAVDPAFEFGDVFDALFQLAGTGATVYAGVKDDVLPSDSTFVFEEADGLWVVSSDPAHSDLPALIPAIAPPVEPGYSKHQVEKIAQAVALAMLRRKDL